MAKLNIFKAKTFKTKDDPEGYRAGWLRFGGKIGAKTIGGSIYDLPPGQSICPYHYEYEEEWLLVLEGQPTLRDPKGNRKLDRGDVVCFPAGPEGAHKVTNKTTSDARVLMISTKINPAVAVYPDSDKIGVWTGNNRDRLMLKRKDGRVKYYEGEA